MFKKVSFFVLSCLMACTANADIVYQNMTGMAAASYRMAANAASSLEFGEQVLLAGVDRKVTELSTIMQVQGIGTAGNNGLNYDFNITVRFRNLLGATLDNTPFYQQTFAVTGLAAPTGTAAAFVLTLPIPEIVVPDQFAAMFAFTRIGGNNGGVGVQFNAANPPAVGVSDPTFFWREQSAGSGTWGTFNFGGTNANVALEITAIPEPSLLGGLLLVGAVVAARRRTSR